MHTTPIQRRAAALLLTGAVLVVPAACGGDDDDAAPATDTTETTAAPASSEPTEDAPEPETVEVTMVDYGYEGLPEEVPAGTKLTVVNKSDVELHEVVAVRLPDGEERPVEELMKLPEAELMALIEGEPDAVLLAPPHGDMIPAVGDGTLAKPGRYLLACFIPTGADPAEYLAAAGESEGGPPQVEGGAPHFVHGMFAELRVV